MTSFQTHEIMANRYQILRKIAGGGMGVVYEAQDLLMGNRVALKRLSLDKSHPDYHLMRIALAHEFRNLATLRHPHIIGVLDYGFHTDEQPFFTMKLLQNAATITEAAQQSSYPEKIRLISELLLALEYLHRHEVIHRDLKPSNVLVEGSQVKVLDFGLAINYKKAPTGSSSGGTLEYMSPEVLDGKPASIQSDLFAVGVIMYEILVGQYPFKSSNIPSLVTSIFRDVVDTDPIAETNSDLAYLVDRLLAKDAAERPGHAKDVLQELWQVTDQPELASNFSIRDSFLQAARFVGREAPLQQLTDAVQQTVTRQKSAYWLIGGPSGVGKSRLVDEIRTQALLLGARVLRGRALAEGGLAFELWREPVRHLALTTALGKASETLKSVVPDIDRLLDYDIPRISELPPDASEGDLVSTIARLLTCQKQPIVLILEELQWADESLLPLKQMLALPETLSGLLVLCTYRSDERPGMVDELPGIQVLQLEPMTDEEIENLAVSMLGQAGSDPELLRHLKRERAGKGNTLFIVEYIRELAMRSNGLIETNHLAFTEEVGDDITEVIQSRVLRLPAWTHRLLQAAALVGRHVDPQVLHEFLSTQKAFYPNVERLDEWFSVFSEAAILQSQEQDWTFRHDKMREAVNHLVLKQAPDDYRLALQSDALDLTIKGGRLHQARANYHRAAEFYGQTFALAKENLPAYRLCVAHARLGFGGINSYNRRYDEAEKNFREAIVIYQTIDTDEARSGELKCLLNIGSNAMFQGDSDMAQAIFLEVNEKAQRQSDSYNIAHSYYLLGYLSDFVAEDVEKAKFYYHESLKYREQEAMDSAASRQVASTYNNLGYLADQEGDFSVALENYERALTLFITINNQAEIANTSVNLTFVKVRLADTSAIIDLCVVLTLSLKSDNIALQQEAVVAAAQFALMKDDAAEAARLVALIESQANITPEASARSRPMVETIQDKVGAPAYQNWLAISERGVWSQELLDLTRRIQQEAVLYLAQQALAQQQAGEAARLIGLLKSQMLPPTIQDHISLLEAQLNSVLSPQQSQELLEQGTRLDWDESIRTLTHPEHSGPTRPL